MLWYCMVLISNLMLRYGMILRSMQRKGLEEPCDVGPRHCTASLCGVRYGNGYVRPGLAKVLRCKGLHRKVIAKRGLVMPIFSMLRRSDVTLN